MAGVKKTIKKIGDIGDSAVAEVKRFGRKAEDDLKDPGAALKRFPKDIGLVPDIPTPEEATIIPIPDQNIAALEARRRRASASRTGKSSTILTEGLGG